MRRATAVMGAALVVFAAAASAQDKPNFSGKWVVDQEKTQAANPAGQGGGGGGGGGGRPGGMGMQGPMTLTLDATSLTSEREGPQGPIKIVYKLDGSEQSIAMGPMTMKAKAKWEGSTIVIEQTRDGQNGPMTTKQIYSLEGEHLVITNETPRGSRKTFYKKG